MLSRSVEGVSEASDGQEALAINACQAIDLMIIDLIMPGKEGLETLVALRQELSHRPRVIAISGGLSGGGADFLPAAQKLGADLTLKKPFRNETLVDAVERLLTT